MPHTETRESETSQLEPEAGSATQLAKDGVKQDTEVSTEVRKPRIARYDVFFDTRTLTEVVRKTEVSKHAKRSHRAKKAALVVKRNIGDSGLVISTYVEIKSPALCKILLDINRDVEGLMLNRNPPIAYPDLFFHSRAALKERYELESSKETKDDDLINDLETVMDYIKQDHSETTSDFDALISSGEITFGLLWALFAPTTLVHWEDYITEQVHILIVRSCYTDTSGFEKKTTFYLSCDIVTYDGRRFGLSKSDKTFKIEKFIGTRKIVNLTIYPLKFAKNWTEIWEKAVARGKRYSRLTGPRFHEISGAAVTYENPSDNEDSNENGKKFTSYGRVMIDPTFYHDFRPYERPNYMLKVYQPLERDELSDEDYAICSPVVYGFCFGVKKWGGFAIDRLKDIVWSEGAFQSLVMGEKQKRLVLSLVKQHTQRSSGFDDIVAGKGKGLIGLLAGNPGCGKTLTAEAVAEVTHRPLYAISAGELGTDPTEIDRKLALILELAKTWGAVLLLDEAEVFLHKRSPTDVARNALVSIFLRQLEYYQGILILTTNMLENCDPAFESRIHFSIRYPDLDLESRKKVWGTFINQCIEREQSSSRISDEDLNRLAESQRNGRQIKNIVSNARSMALEYKEPLNIMHIDAVMEVVDEWDAAKKIFQVNESDQTTVVV